MCNVSLDSLNWLQHVYAYTHALLFTKPIFEYACLLCKMHAAYRLLIHEFDRWISSRHEETAAWWRCVRIVHKSWSDNSVDQIKIKQSSLTWIRKTVATEVHRRPLTDTSNEAITNIESVFHLFCMHRRFSGNFQRRRDVINRVVVYNR